MSTSRLRVEHSFAARMVAVAENTAGAAVAATRWESSALQVPEARAAGNTAEPVVEDSSRAVASRSEEPNAREPELPAKHDVRKVADLDPAGIAQTATLRSGDWTMAMAMEQGLTKRIAVSMERIRRRALVLDWLRLSDRRPENLPAMLCRNQIAVYRQPERSPGSDTAEKRCRQLAQLK